MIRCKTFENVLIFIAEFEPENENIKVSDSSLQECSS